MKWIDNLKEFSNKMLSSESDVSSKRVLGTICIIIYILITIISVIFEIDIKDNHLSLLINLLYVGGSLVGLGIFDAKNLRK